MEAIKVDNCHGKIFHNYGTHTIFKTVALWVKVLSLLGTVGGDKGNYSIISWHRSIFVRSGKRGKVVKRGKVSIVK